MSNLRLVLPLVGKSVAVIAAALLVHSQLAAAENGSSLVLEPGKTIEVTFSEADLPPTLYSIMHGTAVPPCVTFRLPADYTPTKTFPLVLYVPGNDGGTKGNIHNAEMLAGPKGWIAATLPLFKKSVDRGEVAGGVIVSFEDYPIISRAYRTLLGRLFETVPNIDIERSAMVGFSNGSITIAVLVSNHDEFILTHFRNFCLVDHGMFHLTDLHKARSRESRYLILVGDQRDLGRDLKLRRSRLLQDEWRPLGVELTSQVMENTGHEFGAPQMEIVRTWLRSGDPALNTTTQP